MGGTCDLARDEAGNKLKQAIETQRATIEIPIDFRSGSSCVFGTEQNAVLYADRLQSTDPWIKAGLVSAIRLKKLIPYQTFSSPRSGFDCLTHSTVQTTSFSEAVYSRQLAQTVGP